MITSYISHRDCGQHFMGPTHPESPLRLQAIERQLALSGVIQHVQQYSARAATLEQLARVHPMRHLQALEKCPPQAGQLLTINEDTVMCADSLVAARLAAGAVVRGVDQVMRDQADNVFCAVRPPGHHAERADAMGFCFYNNVAVGALHARQHYGVKRIAILDFDVHQGNGTVDIFKHDPDTLVCSSFQDAMYPWRYLESRWEHIHNTPLSEGSGSLAFRRAIEAQWLKKLDDFKPELILISAGFDAHREDPMAELCLEDDDYYWVTLLAMDVARRHCHGRIVSVLEGGYCLEALGRSTEAHLKALAGLPMQDGLEARVGGHRPSEQPMSERPKSERPKSNKPEPDQLDLAPPTVDALPPRSASGTPDGVQPPLAKPAEDERDHPLF
ncbi:histone deacetylase family protein [Cobetia amphilecti]|nr:histone deacetylase family protein [Cobetia litoralis]